MPLPAKALRYGQLRKKTEGLAVPTSGHQVVKMEFVDSDGQVKTGFYKELIPEGVGDGSYPEILAKYSVAASVLIRLALGDRAAEDRLVFDEEGRIKGTLSVNLEKYKPLYSSSQSLPLDPQEKELVCPSVETLLQHNVAELLVSAWRIKCDDRHPGNFSLFGLIDWDMALYPYTYIMKGKRLVDGLTKELPEKGMKLLSKELDDYPNIEGRTHTPTNSWPGNANMWKRYKSYAEFQALSSNPALKTEDGTTSWQEQFFAALLKELLSFDPEMLRARLKEYLGEELILDYRSLPRYKSEQLEKTHPTLFNEKTDQTPFIDHMMNVFQREYNELYSAVVLYPGCPQNKSGVPVVGFNRFLRNKPSAFHNVLRWADAQNDRMSECWRRYEEKKKAQGNVTGALDAYTMPVEGRYHLERMQKRYHQIWRDAHSPTIKAIIGEGYTLIRQLANELRVKPLPLATKELEESDITLLTESFQLIGEPHLLSESKTLDCDPSSDLKKGLEGLEKFVFKLHQCTKEYYTTKREDLSPEHNQAFCDAVSKLIIESESEVLPHLMTTAWARKFGDCISNLQQFYNGLHFQRHCIASDQPLSTHATHDYKALLTRPHTDEEVVQSCLRTLFAWIKTLDKETFNSMVLNTIGDYQPSSFSLFARRYRAPSVETYLKTTTHDCADRLGTILCEGGTDSTSLNTHLMRNLIPIMLEATQAQVDVNLLSVRNAVEHKSFDAAYYAQRAQEFVKSDEQFTFPGSKQNIAEFSKVMFDWAAKQETRRFRALVRKARDLYAPYSITIWSQKERVPEINGYLGEVPRHPNPKLLALILANGGNEENSFNTILLKELLMTMQADVDSQKKQDVPNLEIVSKISPERLPYYGTQLKKYAKPKTYDEKTSTIPEYS
ncbi:Uncharacterised protein [Legionella lansingensis]|uniref:Uncharacterized protein n=1 Tax=Legionella lansingensis TaxID=45067 RepID=A0A0W0VEZ0_9GAMM|nr:hypothetical protein [Legionella lansingensis]KTD18700.1 hypothetical protein Llan_2303 [Legionella lansingensis]SNV57431.1 Uncharacterised protein [Legionella lansingensis]